MRTLFVGDIFGKPGLRTLKALLPGIVRAQGVDFVVANGENSANGFGITPANAREIFDAGVDVITTGNHVWDRREIMEHIDSAPNLIRPANMAPGAPGKGFCIVTARGARVAVLNLVGRIFMDPADCPFRAADAILAELEGNSPDHVLVDFHAEATSEKIALGHHLDGRVTAVVGTHTHVATADAGTLPGGTAYITDVGMTGVAHSVIGLDRDRVTKRFATGLPMSSVQAEGRGRLNAVVIDMEGRSRATIRRIDMYEE